MGAEWAEDYGVDLDQLAEVITQIEDCSRRMGRRLQVLDQRIAGLHAGWEGEAAQAHLVAQESWESGFHDMHAALGAMREAAQTAHDNYSEAVGTNLAMWDQLR